MSVIDALRAPRYARYNQQIVDPPGITWYVAEDNTTHEVVACAALGPSFFGEGVKMLYDALGTNLGAVNVLVDALARACQAQGLGVATWMPLDQPSRINYAIQHGFELTAALLYLKPPLAQREDEGTG